ncbi:MAG: AAA family ATPase, partial [Draconibacterium sp.]|nr:AAA family ATPase [Draconibacterium sp.]
KMDVSTQYLIKLEVKSDNLRKKFLQIDNLFDDFIILDSHDSRKPDLLIFEMGESAQKDIEYVEMLLNSGQANEIFLTSDYIDTALLTKAMRAGVSEFFPQPIEDGDVMQAFDKFKKRHPDLTNHHDKENGQIITVFGSKGGVGTTTLAVNMATSISQSHGSHSVVLIDMNTLFGEIPLFLEMSPTFHWGEITKNMDRLDNTFLSNILASHKSGVKVLPSPAYLNGHIRPTPEIMVRLLGLMKQMFDFIVIDGGQSTDDTSLKIMEISDSILLITILSLPCLANTNKLIRSLTDLGYVLPDDIKVILNRNMRKSNISTDDVESGINKELYWTLPNDFDNSMAAINNGKPLLDIAPNARLTKGIFDLANSFLPQENKKPKKKWSLFKN